jgi:hypothetical protein
MNPLEGQNFLVNPISDPMCELIEDYGLSCWISFSAETALADSPTIKRAPVSDNPEDYSVLENGVVVGRIFKVPVASADRPWMWASGHG